MGVRLQPAHQACLSLSQNWRMALEALRSIKQSFTHVMYIRGCSHMMSAKNEGLQTPSLHPFGGRTRSWMIPFGVENILNYIIAYKIKHFYF